MLSKVIISLRTIKIKIMSSTESFLYGNTSHHLIRKNKFSGCNIQQKKKKKLNPRYNRANSSTIILEVTRVTSISFILETRRYISESSFVEFLMYVEEYGTMVMLLQAGKYQIKSSCQIFSFHSLKIIIMESGTCCLLLYSVSMHYIAYTLTLKKISFNEIAV